MSEGPAQSGKVGNKRKGGGSAEEGNAPPNYPMPQDYANCVTAAFNYNEKFGENARVRVFTVGMSYSIASDCIQEMKKSKLESNLRSHCSMRSLCLKYMDEIFVDFLSKPNQCSQESRELLDLFSRDLKNCVEDETHKFQFRNFCKLTVSWEQKDLNILVPLTRDQWNLEKMHFAEDDSMLIYAKHMLSYFTNFERRTERGSGGASAASAASSNFDFSMLIGEMIGKENALEKLVNANLDFLTDQAVSAEWEMDQKKKEHEKNAIFQSKAAIEAHVKFLEDGLERERNEKENSIERSRALHSAINMDPTLADQNLQRISSRFDQTIDQMNLEKEMYQSELQKVTERVQQEQSYKALRNCEVEVTSLQRDKEAMQAFLRAVKDKTFSVSDFVAKLQEELKDTVDSNEVLLALQGIKEADILNLKRMMFKIVQHKYVVLESIECLQKGIGKLFGK